MNQDILHKTSISRELHKKDDPILWDMQRSMVPEPVEGLSAHAEVLPVPLLVAGKMPTRNFGIFFYLEIS
ncbi:hypothetical protein [Calothrix sp. PCC 6303]|uniref:hypothetical protein n=1 Tax=Calothrix sp. PCC 6303 TaxID=1170562 RepID=UPI0002A058E1|nr:hypothetical protein [Calothrix sp. PCC 6303]AFZ00864.1 hypothetical protein Cal6303_1828 [Calothrix sp. PCC 6303]